MNSKVDHTVAVPARSGFLIVASVLLKTLWIVLSESLEVQLTGVSSPLNVGRLS